MTVHAIRLRGPWLYEPLDCFPSTACSNLNSATIPLVPAPGRIVMPADWGATLGVDFRGRVRYLRHFHRPSNLATTDRVWLVIDEVDCAAEITLNDAPLGSAQGRDGAIRFDITDRLLLRNQLDITVELPSEPVDGGGLARPAGREGLPGGLTGEVRLEIDSRDIT